MSIQNCPENLNLTENFKNIWLFRFMLDIFLSLQHHHRRRRSRKQFHNDKYLLTKMRWISEM